MGIENFGAPPDPILPAEPEQEKTQIEQSPESAESIELTPMEKWFIAGKEDSILTQRGVHISSGRLDLLLLMIKLKDKSDLEAVADLVERKHREIEGRDVNEAILNGDELVVRVESIRNYIYDYGINEFAKGLIEEWKIQAKRTVTAESTFEGQLVASIRNNLNLAELYIAGKDTEKVNQLIIETHKIAVENEQPEWAKRIEDAFPELVKYF